MIKSKSELELARETLEGLENDLLAYRRFQGQSPVIDANIRHKEQQVREYAAKLKELQDAEEEKSGLQMKMF